MCNIYIYVYILSLAINKNEILSFVTTWIDHKGIMICERSQTEEDSGSHLYVESKGKKYTSS